MRQRALWELETDELRASTSEDAVIDRWAEIIAGLRGVEPEHFERLAGRAMELIEDGALDRYPDLAQAVVHRLYELHDKARRAQA